MFLDGADWLKEKSAPAHLGDTGVWVQVPGLNLNLNCSPRAPGMSRELLLPQSDLTWPAITALLKCCAHFHKTLIVLKGKIKFPRFFFLSNPFRIILVSLRAITSISQSILFSGVIYQIRRVLIWFGPVYKYYQNCSTHQSPTNRYVNVPEMASFLP